MTDVGIDFSAEIHATLGRLEQETKGMRKALQDWRMLQETPRFVQIHGVVQLDANGFAVLRFDNDGPDQGRMWYLRKLVIGGVTVSTTVTGRADIFVSTMDYRRYTTLAQFGTQDWRDQATSLPLVGTFAAGEIPLQYMEQLYVVISGGTATQEIHCTGTVEDFQMGAYKSDWSL